MARSSSAYRFTVYDVNDPAVDMLRRVAKVTNLQQKIDEVSGVSEPLQYGSQVGYRRYRVVVRPRLGKDSPHAHLYRKGGALYRWSSQDIRPEHGSRFDVYLHEYVRWVTVSKG